MASMIATNIRLPEEVLKSLKHRAVEERKSVNQMIREAIEISLATPKGPQGPDEDPFEEVVGIARSGIRDGSRSHDDYL